MIQLCAKVYIYTPHIFIWKFFNCHPAALWLQALLIKHVKCIYHMYCMYTECKGFILKILHFVLCNLKPPGHCLCTTEPGRLGCVISIQKGVNGDAYPVAVLVSQKVTKNLPVSFNSPMPGFKEFGKV